MKNVHQTSSPLYVSTINLHPPQPTRFRKLVAGSRWKKIGGWVEVDWWLRNFHLVTVEDSHVSVGTRAAKPKENKYVIENKKMQASGAGY